MAVQHGLFTISKKMHSKKCWVVLTQFWVKIMDKLKHWVKNVIKKNLTKWMGLSIFDPQLPSIF